VKPLIYPQFIGRLGNNLFQIAACIGYAKKHNVGWGIKKGYVERGFNAFQVDKYFPHLPTATDCHDFKTYNEPHFNYKEIPFVPRGTKIVGFWQSIKYFEHCQEDVKKILNIKYVDGYSDYVAIHVRRGDYVQHSGSFPPVDELYITMAGLEMALRGAGKKYLFFSDDIQWCKNFVNDYKDLSDMGFEFSEGRNEYEDLCLMASCGHNIIANSSFSWWGAFLNRNPNKIVVSPHYKNWFGENAGTVKDQTQDLIPDNWIQIRFR
jgi:hypothetical protein